MSGTRKFGAFSGVFTPSILTILGVIMYLRLPAIVGQAGFAGTLVIIAVAHVISVTTGLSVASVATDRKVRGGGTYYMLSRSLGLPIGGTLGIALFVGMSFAVSLYIIGFAESFLGVVGVEVTTNAIRLVGVIVLLVVATVTLISTSLALRAQFFILAAIILSLVAIVLGIGRHEFAPGAATLAAEPLPTAAPFIVLFAIFFPAVTGFEAGVSMSGDLRDPKRSIPIGTIAAILVGLAVYVALAALLAFTVDPRALMAGPAVLADIAIWGPLVLAGVWGATISSALGSTLAAPRILQATSVDRITPALFARGYGRDDEPRLALLLTCGIALIGILIGELDVIARVVSMFFITAYGFLNVACAIESWASPDFRPSFRVPRAIPVLGALACLIVMIQLDLIAMIGAVLVLGGLYFYLTRRQLRLESGDAWSGFWASVARAALHRLDRSALHRRNWRPNVLAFNLPAAPREPLLSMARKLTGRRGMLTIMDVVPGREGHGAVTRGGAVDDAGDAYGVFSRAVESSDPYGCVADMARYHGFAGVEPNALLLTWPTDADEHFATLLGTLAGIDQNLLLLSPSGEPIRRPPRIDVWWWGEPDNATFPLSMLRALTTNDGWQAARVRVLTCTGARGGTGAGLERRVAALLDDMRIDADFRVVPGAAPGSVLADVVMGESAGADLVLLDATPFVTAPRVLDTAVADALRARLRTVLFMFPASSFAGSDRTATARVGRRPLPARSDVAPVARAVPDLRLPDDPQLAAVVERLQGPLDRLADDALTGPLLDAYAATSALLAEAASLVDDSLSAAARTTGPGRPRAERHIRKVYGDMLFRSRQLLREQREERLPAQGASLSAFADHLIEHLLSLPDAIDETVTVTLDRSTFSIGAGDGVRLRLFKLARRAAAPRSSRLRVHVPLRELVRRHLLDTTPVVERAVRAFVGAAAVAATDVQALLASARAANDRVWHAVGTGDDVEAVVRTERGRLNGEAAAMIARHDAAIARVRADGGRAIRHVVHCIAHDMARVDVVRRARVTRSRRRAADAAAARARALPETWQSNHALLLEGAELELSLLVIRNRIATITDRARERLCLHIRNGLIAILRDVRATIEDYLRTAAANPEAGFTRIFESWPDFEPEPLLEELRAELREPAAELPERVETLSPATAARIANGEIDDDIEVVTLALRPLVDYHLDAEFLGPLQERLLEVPLIYARAADTAQDAARLAAFRFGPEPEDGGAGSHAEVLTDALRRIDASTAALDALVVELDNFLADRMTRTLGGLEANRLLRENNHLPQYIRTRRGRRALSRFQQQRRRAERFVGEQAVRLMYQRSEAVRFARELEVRRRNGGALLDLVASVAPDAQVLEHLPYHYRQLFLGNPRFSRELLAGWTAERQLAARAVAHYRRGFDGPLLVLGEPFAGKSALVQHIAEEHFPGAPVFLVAPSRERTTQPRALLDAVASAVGAPPGAEDPLVAAPSGAVIIFDDLDLWWERAPAGCDAVDAALDLMERHARRCVFMASADVHAFRFIDRVHGTGRRFLATIECRPFSAREIADVVQLRHGSTGYTFELDGLHEERLSGAARARLFNGLFDYSAGNIGTALHGWVAHIRGVDGERLHIGRPAEPDLQALDALEPAHRVLLIQLLLHRGLAQDRLLHLGGARPAALAAPLAELRRARAVVEDARGRVVINPFLRPFAARRFTELGLIE